ncbi:Hypothetical protein SMAX5B_001003 [Scophthalmus maximus]|uniref:Uncharacterized protein n=1 Tax=Scophthalmus maximus TaxID=52904 RepID=A0A2U9C191_SCOMX|nr:Hypothetical protein SMAX5B_001003 [Scophthalmus maximus]
MLRMNQVSAGQRYITTRGITHGFSSCGRDGKHTPPLQQERRLLIGSLCYD